jgi:hypothetical protein
MFWLHKTSILISFYYGHGKLGGYGKQTSGSPGPNEMQHILKGCAEMLEYITFVHSVLSAAVFCISLSSMGAATGSIFSSRSFPCSISSSKFM